MLYIGDSVAHNANFADLEIGSHTRIKLVKAYSSVEDSRARWPLKNFSDVTPAALLTTHKEDPFSHLILAAPTVDISNLNTSKLTSNDNTEVYKQHVAISCQNMLSVAYNAITAHPELKKVVLMEHLPRFDIIDVDPIGIKPLLVKYANDTLVQMLQASPMKEKNSARQAHTGLCWR